MVDKTEIFGFLVIFIIGFVIFFPKNLDLTTQIRTSMGIVIYLVIMSTLWCAVYKKFILKELHKKSQRGNQHETKRN